MGEGIPWENHNNSETEICLGYLLNNNRAKNTVDLSELPRDADLILEEYPGVFAAGLTPKTKHWQLHHCWDSANPVLFGNPSLKQQPRLTLLSPGVWAGTFLLKSTMGYCRLRKYTQELHKNTEFLTEISNQILRVYCLWTQTKMESQPSVTAGSEMMETLPNGFPLITAP